MSVVIVSADHEGVLVAEDIIINNLIGQEISRVERSIEEILQQIVDPLIVPEIYDELVSSDRALSISLSSQNSSHSINSIDAEYYILRTAALQLTTIDRLRVRLYAPSIQQRQIERNQYRDSTSKI